jgi:hypothetical protein
MLESMTHIVRIHAALKVRKPANLRQCLAKKQRPYKTLATQTTGIAKILPAAARIAHLPAHRKLKDKQPFDFIFRTYPQQLYVIAAGHSPRHQQHIAQTAWSTATLFFFFTALPLFALPRPR